jgi:hypothetical protein
MYGYDMKELEIFIKDRIGEGLSIASFSDRAYNLPGYLGQGISRTTLCFSRYPNIVFKVCVGEDAEVCYDAGEAEENRWNCAIEEGVAPYFAETEYLCNIKLYGNTWEEEDEYGDIVDGIDYSRSYEVPVYIQSRVDEVWCESDINDALYQSKNSLLKEKKIFDNLGGWISGVDNDRVFAALFIRKYGVSEYEKLSKFIEHHCVEDLHGANWGVKEGNLVIIDYAM